MANDFESFSVGEYIVQIESSRNEQAREALLCSFLAKYKLEAIGYLTEAIAENGTIQRDFIQISSEGGPRYRHAVTKLNAIFKAYANVAERHDCPELEETNLALYKRHYKLLPLVLKYNRPDMLAVLIQLYESLPIVYSKDWGGVCEKRVDMNDEGNLISAICEFDDPKIVPSLKHSLLRGKYHKERVLTTLLRFVTVAEVREYVRDIAETENIFICALTDDKKNAQWALAYLDARSS